MAPLNIDLNRIIAEAYDEVFESIMSREKTHYVIKGGRGSAKSTFMYDLGVIFLLTKGSIVLLRRYKASLRNSVFQGIINSMEKMGVSHLFKVSSSRLEITHIESGRKAFFGGLDDPSKLKSFTAPTPEGFALVGLEETQEVEGYAKIRSVIQTFNRSGNHCVIIYAFNPPPFPRHWTNAELAIPTPRKAVYHFNYYDIPKEWLGEEFIAEAEELKRTNPLAYQNEYEGLAVGHEGQIFKNIQAVKGTIEFDDSWVFRGIDYGYTDDPTAYVVVAYDRKTHSIMFLDEIYGHGIKNRELAPLILKENPQGYTIMSEQDQRTIDELTDLGVDSLVKVYKGKDSVSHGTKWLIDLNAIYIDPIKTPNVYKEFTEYAYPLNASGTAKKHAYPDKDNHAIDATRYALEDVIRGLV